jgi:starvation-inducible DNA-binding protein
MTRALNTVPRAEVASLEEAVVELIDLSIQAEQAHWTIAGRGSKSLQLFLNQLIDQASGWHDEVAQRLGITCTSAVRHIATRAAATPLELLPTGDLGDHDVAKFFDHSIGSVADRMRSRLDPLGKADPATQDLLRRIIDGLDQQVLMLRGKLSPDLPNLAMIRGRSTDRRDSSAA